MVKKIKRLRKEKNKADVPLEIRERANRLRFLRKIARLSMREFAQHCNIGLTTVNYWEQGYSSVTERGAKKVSNAMREEGIECSVLWLMSGFGEQPKIIDSSKLSKLNYKTIEPSPKQIINEQTPSYQPEDTIIQEEVALFKKNYPDHLIYYLDNESMEPIYCRGDWLGGKKLTEKNMELACGMDCIIELEEKKLLVRRVKRGHSPNSFDIYVINPDASLKFTPLHHVKAIALAPIIRIWKSTKF